MCLHCLNDIIRVLNFICVSNLNEQRVASNDFMRRVNKVLHRLIEDLKTHETLLGFVRACHRLSV